MSDDATGYERFATLQDGTVPDYEEGDTLHGELDDEYRVVHVLDTDSGASLVEKALSEGDRWVRVAEFDGDNSFYMAEQFLRDNSLSGYRVVDVVGEGIYIERLVSVDE